MKDKRTHPRFGPLVIKASFSLQGSRREGYLTNVSLGGAFLAIEDPPPLLADLELQAMLPFRLGELQAKARVVWRSIGASEGGQKLTGAGLAFIALAPEARSALEAYLARFAELASRIGEGSET